MTKFNIEINEIFEEYKPDNSLFSDEDEDINRLKNIIYNDLGEVDKRIILMYSELHSVRKLGKELGVSPSTALIRIHEIRNKILNRYGGTKAVFN